MAQSTKQRGRIFIYIALILILGVVLIYWFVGRKQFPLNQPAASTPAPATEMTNVIFSVQAIPYGTELTENLLTTLPYPKNLLVPGVMYTDMKDLIGKRAKMDLEAKVPITSGMISEGLSGSLAAFKIPEGMVAVTIPILNPIASVGYAPQAGDHVNVIASMLFVDVDPTWQSSLPNNTARIIPPPGAAENPSLVAFAQGMENSAQGRAEQDAALQQPFYLQPSEGQRPRLVTQTILQDVMVLGVGEFPLTPETVTPQGGQVAVVATPAPAANQQQQPTTVKKPKIITIVVTPQDAVTINYLLYSGAEMTLALRGAGDDQRVKTDAVTMQYTMDTYTIPLPSKQPYAMQPGIVELTLPVINEEVVAAPR